MGATPSSSQRSSRSKKKEQLLAAYDSDDDSEYNEKPATLVYLYMTGCGHCVRFGDVWTHVKEYFEVHYGKDIIVFKRRNSHTVTQVEANNLNLEGYPTIYLEDSDLSIHVYQGSMTRRPIIRWIKKVLDLN